MFRRWLLQNCFTNGHSGLTPLSKYASFSSSDVCCWGTIHTSCYKPAQFIQKEFLQTWPVIHSHSYTLGELFMINLATEEAIYQWVDIMSVTRFVCLLLHVSTHVEWRSLRGDDDPKSRITHSNFHHLRVHDLPSEGLADKQWPTQCRVRAELDD